MYMIEAFTDPKNADLKQIQQIMEDTFSKEEVDRFDVLQAAIMGETMSGGKDICRYQVYGIKDGDQVIALFTGGTLDMKNKQGKDTGEMVFMESYAVTVPEYLHQGLARELYISAVIGAVLEAKAQNKKLVGIIGETTSRSEKTWESVKQRRVYVQDTLSDGTVKLIEVPYIQPALEFDENGQPTEDAGESPEHLMVDYYKEGQITKEQLVQMVGAIYSWCNIWPKSEYAEEGKSDEEVNAAYQNNINYVRTFEQQFADFLNSHGNLILMNSKEKEKAEQEGKTVEIYTAADRQDTTPK